MQELVYQELGIKSNTFQIGAGIRKAGLTGPMRRHDSKGLMLYWPEGNSESLSETKVSLKDTFSLKERLGEHFMYYSWMLIVMPRTDNEEDET
eukprot:3616387-Amphidinium_carterae.2